MRKITNLTIQNIKGFGIIDNSFNNEILSGKINILVAPNGFGKSSITTGFNSLKTGKLELDKENFHKGDINLSPFLSITEENTIYTADKTQNEISSNFKVFCVKNLINATAVSKNMGKFVSTTGYLGIDNIEIVKTIPQKAVIPYPIKEIKAEFGKNAKILPNISVEILNSNIFLSRIDNYYVDLERFSAQKRKLKINKLIFEINSIAGTSEQIKNNFNIQLLQEIQEEDSYKSITDYIQQFNTSLTDLELFLYFYELQFTYFRFKTVFKDSAKRADYLIFKDYFNNNISILGSTWKGIKAVEQKKALVVNFPHATDISYGQRDMLTLCIMLQLIKSKIRIGDKCIVIIDEVFDYLDAVNMTIAQYYLSEMLNKLSRNSIVYPIIMTHLNPNHFRNYVFSPKKMNIQYLKNVQAQPNINMRNLLLKREDLTIKDDVSKNLLHYSIEEINKRIEFRNLNLSELWGEGLNFLQYITDEVNKYLAGNSDFEPYAVCTALRIRIEKLIYDLLNAPEHKQEFLNTHKTKKKLEFAETILGELPDIYYILGIIYNDAEHLKDENSDKPVIYRLNNVVIKDIVRKIFNYNNELIAITAIH